MTLGEKENDLAYLRKLAPETLSKEEIILKNSLSLLDPIEAKGALCIGSTFKDNLNYPFDSYAAFPKQKTTQLKDVFDEAIKLGLLSELSNNTSMPFLSYLWFRKTERDTDSQSYILTKTFGPNGLTGYFLLEMKAINPSTNESVLEHVQQITQTAFTKIILLGEQFKKESRLTPREKDIIKWIAHGKSNLEISELMEISIHTVSGYIRAIYLKTNTSDRVSIGFYALHNGILD